MVRGTLNMDGVYRAGHLSQKTAQSAAQSLRGSRRPGSRGGVYRSVPPLERSTITAQQVLEELSGIRNHH